ncbi:DHH family protein [Clostridium argentinense CDC 2741]|uniref:DHH family protein n=1 Tax=Clostridium argentinense CDC 2741 TaxID=1418104 RepID=A0A0C1U6P4_9CLOT|nr:DHH family phosphoesterase [Clostridium argentinense]ARC84587.1 delta(24)-sterol C-methyltransferase [Clostridium argentinense]KIE47443.1 DHH family protein [Clostridium argentinense CDC 2741]NFF38630.1 delta(24)-sterol C-methyltransferase [Clostridium argentinense]NFP48855.1 delta(24)-sterol C-methyltransferase [Clostridium argentinense]NFP72997.1 delta(24)-sterol C-methyltransferase [Clostridium argentinense]
MDEHYIKNTYNPLLLKGMKNALRRIIQAINEREKIVVYGYYDFDSITAISLLILVLRYLNADVEYFQPNEARANRNLNDNDIQNYIKYLGADLIITVGSTINSEKEIALCKELNIDIIVTDYHKTTNNMEDIIVVNPNQKGCNYPFKNLSAVGVAYKLAQTISSYYKMSCINKYTDLVMLGTISKGSPIVGENSYIVEEGLKQLSYTNNYGIRALLDDNNVNNIEEFINSNLTIDIFPKSNSMGRIDNAKIAIELFTTNDSYRAKQISKYLYNEIKRTNKRINKKEIQMNLQIV